MLEVTFAAALGFLLLQLAVRLNLQASRSGQRSQNQLILQQSASFALHQVVSALQRSTAAGVSLARSAERVRVAAQPCAVRLSTPARAYRKELVAFDFEPATGVLTRFDYVESELPPLDSQVVERLESARLLALPAARQHRNLAAGVLEFEVTSKLAPPNLSNPLLAKIRLRRANLDFELERTIFMRNSSQ